MLKQLSPKVRRQAVRLVGRRSPMVEDLYQEGRIKLWLLLKQGQTDPAYLLKSTRNTMLNTLRHQSYEPRPFAHDDEDPDPWLFVSADDHSIPDTRARCVIDQHDGNLRSALVKVCFTGEPMDGAERVALCRYRKQQQEQEWL